MINRKKSLRILIIALIALTLFVAPALADITGGSVDNCNIYGSSGSNTFSPSGDPTGSSSSNITNTSGVYLKADSSGTATYDPSTKKVTFQITVNGVNGYEGAAVQADTTGTKSGFAWTITKGSSSWSRTWIADGSTGQYVCDWFNDIGEGGTFTATLVMTNDSGSATVNFASFNVNPWASATIDATEGPLVTSVTMTADGGATGTIGWQWQSSSDGTTWSDISGATSQTYTASINDTTSTLHYYRIKVTDTSASSPAYASVTYQSRTTPSVTVTANPTTGGLSATVNLTISGSATSYQWQKSTDGTTYTNWGSSTTSTTNSDTISDTTGTTHYYRVLATNSGGTSISSVATYTSQMPAPVLEKVEITNPTGRTVYGVNEDITLTVTVTSGSPTSYTWQDGTTTLTGTDTYTGKFAAGTHNISVTATNAGGTSTAVTTSFTTYDAPTVTASTTTATVKKGGSISLTSTPTGGAGTLTYKWYQGSTEVATTQNPTVTASSTAGTYNYKVTVTDQAGQTGTSNEVTITVATEPTVTISPTTLTVKKGGSISCTATVSGGQTPYSYQWYKGSSSISGQTSATLTTTAGSTAGTETYHVVVTDNLSQTVTSGDLTVSVVEPKLSKIEASSTSIIIGDNVTLTATVDSGSSTISSYQWYDGTSTLGTAQTTNTYTTNALTIGSHTIKCIVTDSYGQTFDSSTLSSGGTVTINVTGTPTITSVTATPSHGTSGIQVTLKAEATPAVSGHTLTYSWKAGSTSVGTGQTITVNPTTTTTYTVTVTESVTSQTATGTCTFTLESTPTYTATAQNASGKSSGETGVSQTITLSYTPTATSVKWQKSSNGTSGWTDLSGNTETFTDSSATIHYYRGIVTSGSDTYATNVATFTTVVKPTITAVSVDPTSGTASRNISLKSTITGAGSTTGDVQWYVKVPSGSSFTAISGATTANYTYAVPATTGTYTFHVTAKNLDVSVTSSDVTYVANPGGKLKDITISGSEGPQTTNVTLGITPEDMDTYWWMESTDGTTFTKITGSDDQSSYTYSITDTGVASIVHTFKAKGNDLNGNDVESYTVTFTTFPKPTVTNLEETSHPSQTDYGVNQTLKFEATDSSVATVTAHIWKLDGTEQTGVSGNEFTTSTLTAGYHTISVEAKSVGGMSDAKTLTVEIKDAPTITVSASSTAIGTGGSVTFTSTPNGGVTGAQTFKWWEDTTELSTTEQNPTLTMPLTEGTYTYKVQVTDLAGQSGDASIDIAVVNLTAKAFPTELQIGSSTTTTTLTVNAPTGATVQWYDGTSAITGATKASYTWEPTTAGEHTVKADVTFAGTTTPVSSNNLTIKVYDRYTLSDISSTQTTMAKGATQALTWTIPSASYPPSSTKLKLQKQTNTTWEDIDTVDVKSVSSYDFTPSTAGTYKFRLHATDGTFGDYSSSNELTITVIELSIPKASQPELQIGSSITKTKLSIGVPTGTSTIKWYNDTTYMGTGNDFEWEPTTIGTYNKIHAVVTVNGVDITSSNITVTVYGTYTIDMFDLSATEISTSSTATITSVLTPPASLKSGTEIKIQKTDKSTPAESDWIDTGHTISDPTYDEYEIDGATYGVGTWKFRLHYGESTFGYKNSSINTLEIGVAPTMSITSITPLDVKYGNDVTLKGKATSSSPILYTAWQKSTDGSAYSTIVEAYDDTPLTYTWTSPDKGEYWIKLYSENKFGNSSTIYTNHVNVWGEPTVTASVDRTAIETGTALTLTGTATPDTTHGKAITSTLWEYSNDGGSTWNTIGTSLIQTYTPTTTGTYKFKFTVSDGLYTIEKTTSDVTVNSKPVISKSSATPSALGEGNNINLTSTITSSTGSYTSKWQYSATGGLTWIDITGATTDNYTWSNAPVGNLKIRQTATNTIGTTDGTEHDVAVYGAPSVTVSATPSSIILGDSITITPTVTVNPTLGDPSHTETLKYSKDGGAEQTVTSPFTPTDIGTYVFTAYVSDTYFTDIVSTNTATVTVTSGEPVINSVTAYPSAGVSGTTTTLTVNATSVAGGHLSYEWSAGGSIIGTDSSIIVSPTTTTTYTIKVTDSNAPSQPATDTVTFTVISTPAYSVSANPTGSGLTYSTQLTANGSGGSDFQWQELVGGTWTDLSGKTSSSVMVSGIDTDETTHQYRVIYTNGTFRESSEIVEFKTYKLPVQPTDSPTCSETEGGLSTNVTLSIDDSSAGTITERQWQYSEDGGSTWNNIENATTNPWTGDIVFTIGGSKLIKLNLTNPAGTTSTKTTTFVAHGAPVITNTTINPIEGKLSEYITMSATITDATTIQWQQSDDGTNYTDISGAISEISTNMVTFTTAGTKYIRVSAKNNYSSWSYGDAKTYTAVNPPVISVINVNPNEGGLTKTVSLTATVTGATSYLWYLDERTIPGASDKDWTGNITVSSEGTHSIRLEASGVGGTTQSSNVTYTAYTTPVQPTSPPTIDKTEGGLTVNLTLGEDETGVGTITERQWEYSLDGTNWTSISGATTNPWNGSVTFPSAGTYQIRVKLTNPAGSSYSPTVSYTAWGTISISDVTVTPTEGGLTGTVTLNATVTGANTYQWKVSEDGSSWADVGGATTVPATASITFTSSGVKYFKLVASNPQTSKDSDKVNYTAFTTPVITNESVNPSSGTPTKNITLDATVTGATSYAWSMKKPSESSYTVIGTPSTPQLVYALTETELGEYKFKLTATNIAGSSTSNDVIYTALNTPAVTNVTVNPTSGHVHNVLSLSATVTGANSMYWEMEKPDGTKVQLGTTPTYVYSFNESVGGDYKFHVIATNDVGTTTSVDAIYSATVLPVPIISNVYTNPSVIDGPDSITLGATVDGQGETTTIQWYIKKPSSANYVAITGATTATYQYNLTDTEKGVYSFKCEATNSYGTSDSYTKVTMNNSAAESASKGAQSGILIAVLSIFAIIGGVILFILLKMGDTKLFIMGLISICVILIAVYLFITLFGNFEWNMFGFR